MLGTKSRALIVLGCGQLPAEAGGRRPGAEELAQRSLSTEAYLSSGLGPTIRQLFVPWPGGVPETCPSTQAGGCERCHPQRPWAERRANSSQTHPFSVAFARTQAHLPAHSPSLPSASGSPFMPCGLCWVPAESSCVTSPCSRLQCQPCLPLPSSCPSHASLQPLTARSPCPGVLVSLSVCSWDLGGVGEREDGWAVTELRPVLGEGRRCDSPAPTAGTEPLWRHPPRGHTALLRRVLDS